MTTIEQLKASRASRKGYITRVEKIIDEDDNKLNATDLNCRLELLEGYFSNFLTTQDAIDALLPGNAAEEDYRASIEDLYCSLKSKILTRIANLKQISIKPAIIPSVSSDDLPKLKPPTFAGEYTEYNNFIQQFKATIDSKPIPTIRKFQLLVDECLKGEAKLTIKSLDVTEDNYAKALELLKKRYDNKCIVFQTHIRGLYHLPVVSRNSGAQLRRFVDCVDGHLGALRSLGTDTDIVNALLIYIASLKLDAETYKKWEDSLELEKLPTWSECSSFLNRRSQHLDIREPQGKSTSSSSTKLYPSPTEARTKTRTTLAVTELRCAFCSVPQHKISDCNKFNKLKVYQRFQTVKRLGLCINCMQFGHSVKECLSSKCRVCNEPHHSLLHRFQVASPNPSSTSTADQGAIEPEVQAHATSLALHSLNTPRCSGSHVFLATAIVNVRSATGEYIPARVLMDSGSQLNLISEHLAQRLRLKRINFNGELSGIGNINFPARQKTFASLTSRLSDFEINLDFWILSSITSKQPDVRIDVDDWCIPSDITLADPNFNRPQRIDMLIGADMFFELLADGQIKLGEERPLLRNTMFGWIVVGKFNPHVASRRVCNLVSHDHQDASTDDSLNDMLQRFMSMEEVHNTTPNWTEEQMVCENMFCNTIQQRADGRLVVQLPFKEDPKVLGDSRRIAEKRLMSLERRLEKVPEIKQQYLSFMREYEALGHMTVVAPEEISSIQYYIPHQFVLRPESSSTKLRVVFDASCRTSSNVSLNDILMVGPTVQQDLYAISLRFRSHKIALTADIPKMYRQIFVRPTDANFQGILWRENTRAEIRVFRLTTVTYGTSSAPYHATRCLLYLAENHEGQFPVGSAVIKRDFYIDDLISGADTLDEAKTIRFQTESILKSAGLELKKWYSNEVKLMDTIPASDRETPLRINDNDVIKALGIVWEPLEDVFQFVNPLESVQSASTITKRTVLSDLARLFDPLGLVNPVVVLGKIFLQRLWIAKVGWDEDIADELKEEWIRYRGQLWELTKVRIPRHIFSTDCVSCELHGFSDASLRAFGCCIYVRIVDVLGNVSVRLLSGKSKVAPVSTQTLPRLELCASLLLSRLLGRVLDAFGKKFDKIILWTDSEVVLDWLADHPSSWNTFVANRVSIIHELTVGASWRHVDGKSNPADIISRGATVSDMVQSIWFDGPAFLYRPPGHWPATTKRFSKGGTERRKINAVLLGAHNNNFDGEVADLVEQLKFVNNYKQTVRVFAYCYRFIENLKKRYSAKHRNEELRLGDLETCEYEAALLKIVFCIQQNRFRDEIVSLQSKNEFVSSKSRIRKLNPFLKPESVVTFLIRVGGRLEHSELPYDAKHPILLPKSHPFVRAYLNHLHTKNYHAGAQALVSISRQMFWIIDARSMATSVVHKCLQCFRMRPRLREQIMGDLPASRVCIARPFATSGVDFCGPFSTSVRIRGSRTTKSYMAVFVCFATKAVHLEVVSDLSTKGFLAALRRFIARRGICRHLYCDNATNFVGARNELAELRNQFYNEHTQSSIQRICAEDNIEFHHIPPRSPHFGGLWESAVKSAKALFIRTCSSCTFTFEELSTVAAEIEAILNSRPLTPLTSDPSDEQVLTPGHFIVGSPLTSFVEPDITSVPRLSRWQQLNAIRQHFWKRWSREYIVQLQHRYKWNTSSADVKPGMMVLISDDNLPPQKWLLGRIVNTIQGKDGHIRVVSIRTKNGIISRAVHKVAPLPFEDMS